MERVQCPPSLYKVTGLRRKDDVEHPAADLELALTNNGRTTTMQANMLLEAKHC